MKTSSGWPKTLEKMTDSTSIISKGFSTLQKMPSTDLRYLVLMSLETRSISRQRYFLRETTIFRKPDLSQRTSISRSRVAKGSKNASRRI